MVFTNSFWDSFCRCHDNELDFLPHRNDKNTESSEKASKLFYQWMHHNSPLYYPFNSGTLRNNIFDQLRDCFYRYWRQERWWFINCQKPQSANFYEYSTCNIDIFRCNNGLLYLLHDHGFLKTEHHKVNLAFEQVKHRRFIEYECA